ncbi:hypothetical protein I3843_11G104300 [Carya illinoinensis]|nr:hypothetical protein I3843_11G104300 [Carya illinoinensis]
MNDIFNAFTHFTIVYIDDVLIFSKSIDEHWKHLQTFLDIIRINGLVVSAKKINLFQTKIRFLGYDILESKIRPINRAIEFADKFPDVIIDKNQLQRFLGSLNYVAEFYQNMRKQCKPLFDRLHTNPPVWTDIHTNLIKQIKAYVKTLPCLGIPTPDSFKIVETDASDIGYGGILKQKFETSILGMIQSSLFNGPVYFDYFPDLPLALNDPNILKALTLNIATSGYDMIKGSKLLAVIYRIYYRVLKSTLNPKTVLKSIGGKTLLIQSSTPDANVITPDANVKVPTMIHWKDISLPNEWILNQEVPPAPILTAKPDLDYIQQYLDGTVKISFDPTPATSFRRNFFAGSRSSFNPAAEDSKDVETSKGKSIKEEANKDDEDTSTLSPTASDMAASIAPLPSQLNVINRNYFEIDLISLFKDYDSKENRDKRKTYHATFSNLEKSHVKRKWKEKMNTEQKHILFFDFLENYYVSKNSLNVLKTDFSSHPPLEAIVISHLSVDLTASPFKAPNTESNNQEINTVLSETKKIIQQNNFSNTYLQTIGQQLDRIEEKIENPISIQSSTPISQSTNKPLIILPEKRPIFDPRTKQTKTLDQINQMLKNIKIEKPSSSKPEKPSTTDLTNKEEEDGFVQTTNADSSKSDSSTVRNIDLLEKNFHQDDFKLAGLESKPNPMSFTRNWYSKPTPPDLQFEEKIFQSQSSYSADKTYEWNIDGMSEQEILNTMSKMSLVANAYINNNIREPNIVVILTTGFTGMIRNWWDKHLFPETREAIQHAVKKDDNGLPVLIPLLTLLLSMMLIP